MLFKPTSYAAFVGVITLTPTTLSRFPVDTYSVKSVSLHGAQGITHGGGYNGCPYCSATLLRPDPLSLAAAVVDCASDFTQDFLMVSGGRKGLAVFLGLIGSMWVSILSEHTALGLILYLLSICYVVSAMYRLWLLQVQLVD